jgi:hypothetical protein
MVRIINKKILLMKRLHFQTTFFFLIFLGFLSCKTTSFAPTGKSVGQVSVSRIEQMPNLPEPYHLKNWKQTALDFDAYAFDFSVKGQYLPLIWLDSTGHNFKQTTFGLYTAMGDVREGPQVNNGQNHEALGAQGAILGATLVGIDKSRQDGRNYVGMLRNFFNRDSGWNIVQNFTNKSAHIGGGYGNDFWYDVFNNVLFYAVGNYYPEEEGFDEIMHTIAEQFYQSDSIMGDNYSYSYFDFNIMKPGKNHIPAQEDVAAGYSFILYSAYQKFGEEKYLRAAKHALKVLESQKENRNYEMFMPFGAYMAARMNAEAGGNFDPQKFMNWTFDGDAVGREGWGVITGNWGGYDVSGLAGSTIHNGGYGFLMNTFDLAWPLAAMLRSDQRYARAVGKWMLNASNAARLLYPYEIPDSLQALPEQKAITKNVIAYEGLIKESIYPEFKGITPFAQGDGPLWAPGMPPETMFSVYGSGHVGIFGAIIQPTNVERILRIDCVATDMFLQQKAYPTYLFYNPYPESKSISTDLGNKAIDIYDAISRTFLKKGVKGQVSFDLPADAARLLIYIPSGLKFQSANGMLMADGIPVDFRYGQ